MALSNFASHLQQFYGSFVLHKTSLLLVREQNSIYNIHVFLRLVKTSLKFHWTLGGSENLSICCCLEAVAERDTVEWCACVNRVIWISARIIVVRTYIIVAHARTAFSLISQNSYDGVTRHPIAQLLLSLIYVSDYISVSLHHKLHRQLTT